MKFEIKSWIDGSVIFAAEIDCDESAAQSVRLGLAVRAAVRAGASLDGADLYRASLNGASLNGASLDRASLHGANLNGASLNGASLDRASLDGANLDGANLDGASLNGASLNGASLNGASLDGAGGLNDWIKSIQIEDWPITYTSDVIQIGCQQHSIADWQGFSDAEIAEMDGRKALKFWRKWKAWIFQTIEMAPAKPTNPADKEGA